MGDVIEDSDMFEKRVNNTIINGFTTLGIAMGQELGLFEALAAFDQAATSEDIASQAGCKERYVREWLRFMVVADIVEIQGDQYYLPQHRRGPLISESKLMSPAQFVTSLPFSHRELMECFKVDGPPGYSYSKQSRMCSQFGTTRPAYFKKTIPKIVDQIPGLKEKLENGINMCEIGCGSGHCVVTMATMYPNSRFTGIDLDADAINEANTKVQEQGLQNIELIVRDCTTLPIECAERFDFVMFSEVVHDLAYPIDVLKESLKVLKQGCYISITENNMDEDIEKQKLAKEHSIMCYACSLYYCMTCALQFEGAAGSGSCVGKQKIVEFVSKAGFKDVRLLDIPDTPYDCHVIAQK